MTGADTPAAPLDEPIDATGDHRGSWVPSGAMIATRLIELRKRRGLMITLILVTVGIPTVFLGVRLILHVAAPKTYGAPIAEYAAPTAICAALAFGAGT